MTDRKPISTEEAKLLRWKAEAERIERERRHEAELKALEGKAARNQRIRDMIMELTTAVVMGAAATYFFWDIIFYVLMQNH